MWSTQGVGFEYPACYRIENRVLALRAAALFLFSLVLMGLALADPEPSAGAAAALLTKADRGNPLPHILVSVLLLVLGTFDVIAAARQRRVMLVPGQPVSLAPDLMHQSTGTSIGAKWLQQVLASSMVPERAVLSPYARALVAVAPGVASAPSTLQDYLRLRVAHLLFGASLLAGLGLVWAVAASRPALPLAVMVLAGLAAALVARSAWITRQAPSPLPLAVMAVVGALAAGAVAFLGGSLPYVTKLAQLALPQATALVLGSLLVIEGLALLAARAQVPPAPQVDLRQAEHAVDFAADPARLMQEIERELHRYWSDGVPNRRHAWEPPSATEGGEASALVLEESQPAPPSSGRGDRSTAPPATSQPLLLALAVLGLVLTLAGGVMLVRVAYAHLNDATSPLASWASAVVLVVAGGYALRVGHLLWSRFEVGSILLWITFKSEAGAAAARPTRLKVVIARVRSMFYAGGDHELGSRTLLGLTGDETSARRFVQTVRGYAERAQAQPAEPAAAAPMRERPAAPAHPPAAAAPARPPAAAPWQPPANPAPPATRPQPRFCSNCGTPVLAAARFCQQCGHALHAG